MHSHTLDTLATAGVYPLAFYFTGEHVAYPPARTSRYAGALHYLGVAADIRARIEAHRSGRGGEVCRHAR